MTSQSYGHCEEREQTEGERKTDSERDVARDRKRRQDRPWYQFT